MSSRWYGERMLIRHVPTLTLGRVPTADATADGYALALEEARRALDEQERTVAHLSTRAGILLSSGAIVTSLLGAPVLARGHVGPTAWTALAAFLAHGVATLSILRPRDEWQFSIDPASLLTQHVNPVDRPPTPAPEIRHEMALHMGGSADRNRRKLRTLTKAFNIASVLLAIEVLAWVVTIVIES